MNNQERIQINRDSLKKIIKLQAKNKVLQKWIDKAQHHNYCETDDVTFSDILSQSGIEDSYIYGDCTCGLHEILNDSN